MEHERALREFTVQSAQEIGVTLGDAHVDQFMSYLDQLLEWNKIINLTAITDQREIIAKHFIDSLSALAAIVFPPNAVVIDVGSGAGFPGIPLKIVRSDLKLVLIEPVQKKCSFLRFMTGLLRLKDAAAFEGTIEQYMERPLYPSADAVMIRAIRLEGVRDVAIRLLSNGGKFVLYRTEPINQQEIGTALTLETEKALKLPGGYGQRVVSVLTKSR